MGLSAQTLRQTPMDEKRAAIYSRVSTIDQGERYSPGIQQAKLLEKARAEGYIVPPEWMFLDKHTGKDTERPDFERLRKLVKSGAPKAVFALGVDRLARKVIDAAIVAGEFKRHGCILDFVEMKNDDSPEGRLQFTLLAGVAEYMGEKIVEKGIAGHMEMIDGNRIPGHAVLFGHDRHPAEKGRRIKNETEAGYVLKMCQMIDSGLTSWDVASWLNERGILGKRGNEWSGKTVRQLVSNKSLIGECHTRGKIIAVPRLVSDELFYRVQKRLAENAKNRAGRHPGESLLSRFICDEQEHRMRAGRSGEDGKYRFYYCGKRTNKPPTYRLCDLPNVKADAIEQPVFSMVWETITDPARMMRAARAFHKHRQPQPSDSTAGIERELGTVKRKYSNIRQMCESGHYEFAEKKAELDGLKRRITSLEAELHSIAPVLQMPDERALEALMRKADASQEPEDFAERRAILETIQDFKVTYSRSGEFVVTGKYPLGPEAGSKRKVSNWDASEGQNPNSIPFYLKGKIA